MRKCSHTFRLAFDAKEQGRKDGIEVGGGGGGRLQTDPFVDFPQHCILQYSIFKNVTYVSVSEINIEV